MSHLRYYENSWKLLTVLDVSLINEKLRVITNSYRTSKALCQKGVLMDDSNDTLICSNSAKILGQFIENLKTKEQTLHDLIGHVRIKRGWFNAIGSVFKTVVGTMDQGDADYYNDVIDKISKDDKNILNLLAQQTQVVKSTIVNFNTTVSNFQKNEIIFNTNLRRIEQHSKNISMKTMKLEAKQGLDERFALTTLLCNELDREYSELINAILFAKSEQIHPSIITPKQFIVELQKTASHLPPSSGYPLSLDLENAHEILQLSTLSGFYMKEKLIFVINIPLVMDTKFDLYHLTPLPIHNGGDAYLFIIPGNAYLALSQNRMQYNTLSNINDCKLISTGENLCKLSEPIFSLHTKPICETDLLSAFRIPASCDTRISHLKSEIWHKLSNRNAWIYILPTPTHITINCKQRAPEDHLLIKTGILSLEPACKAYTSTTILTSSFNNLTSNFTQMIPKVDISQDDCCLPHKDNISELSLTKLHISNLNIDDLQLASHKLDDISKIADELSRHEITKTRISWYSYITYILVLMLIIFIIFKLCNCLKLRNRRHSHETLGCCATLTNCLTFNIRETNRPTSIELESVDGDSSPTANVPLRRSQRHAQIRDRLA